jgi:hypothetical protein
LITKLESYTNHAVHEATAPQVRPAQNAGSSGVRTHVAWDVTLALCTLGYLAMVLFDDVESPLLSLALMVVVAYELIQPHVRNR